jgi:hypothetical protein
MTRRFDAVASLDNWVEHGVPPEQIVASRRGTDRRTVARTRCAGTRFRR